MLLFVGTVFIWLRLLQTAFATDLDDYVWKTDENFGYVYMGEEYDMHGRDIHGTHTWTGYVLNMTSQKWLTDEDFSESSQSKSLWWHYLVVIVPDEIKFKSNGTLYITGGSCVLCLLICFFIDCCDIYR